MTVWVLIGLAVGLVMGLTGAGAAMAAYPLLIHVAHFPLATCTVIALVVVVCGSGLNGWFQRKSCDLPLGALVSLFSIPGTLIASWLKPSLPAIGIKCLILLLCVASFTMIWRKPKKQPSAATSENKLKTSRTLKVAPLGASIGALVTLTGLGGGFLLVPSYIHFFGLTLTRAVATSLFTIFLTAAGSTLIQSQAIANVMEPLPLVLLIAGTFSSACIVRKVSRSLSPTKFERLQKWFFSFVVISAFISVLLAH